jgi:hypothetical protein
MTTRPPRRHGPPSPGQPGAVSLQPGGALGGLCHILSQAQFLALQVLAEDWDRRGLRTRTLLDILTEGLIDRLGIPGTSRKMKEMRRWDAQDRRVRLQLARALDQFAAHVETPPPAWLDTAEP